MRPFPDNFELENFFECEPEVLDEDMPWACNELNISVTTFQSSYENNPP